jgi:Nucleotidyltransferase domain
MPVTLISDDLVRRYSAGPSQAKVNQATSLREDVEEALGSDYKVFLQGSYRNNTGVSDLNDVDIVALSKTVHSTVGRGPALYPVSWDEIFGRVERALDAHWRFNGRVSRGDKCVRVATELKLDVVPAIYRNDPETDPIEVYSFREGSRRDNYPRVHWENGTRKNSPARTDGAFKPTVRLFKRWARNVLSDPKVAPSFYIECAVHHVPDDRFHTYLPVSFVRVGLYLLQEVSRTTVVNSVAGDKDILVPQEWHPDRFEQFQGELAPSIIAAGEALSATTTTEANRLWRGAFGE